MANAPDTFPRRLQWLRERRGISRRVLSELCGLNKNQIARYERGSKRRTSPRLSRSRTFLTFPSIICCAAKGRGKPCAE